MAGPALLTTSSRRTNEDALKAAFATNDLRRICRAVDEAVLRGGIAKVAQDAKVDRTTIYRAFRRENGPALDTMVRVLHVLGLRLIVEIKPNPSPERLQLDPKTTARSLTTSFRSGVLDLSIEALAKALRLTKMFQNSPEAQSSRAKISTGHSIFPAYRDFVPCWIS